MNWLIGYVSGGQDLLFKARALNRYGVDVYVPVTTRTHAATKNVPAWSEEWPLLGNYVFIPHAPNWQRLLNEPTLDYVITRLEQPVLVPDTVIERMRRRAGETVVKRDDNVSITAGDLIKVNYGPYNSLIFPVVKTHGPNWLSVPIFGELVKIPRSIVELY